MVSASREILFLTVYHPIASSSRNQIRNRKPFPCLYMPLHRPVLFSYFPLQIIGKRPEIDLSNGDTNHLEEKERVREGASGPCEGERERAGVSQK